MHRFVFWLSLLWLLLPNLSMANTGVVRGGEHEGFTRLTISLEKDVTELSLDKATNGVSIKPKLDGLETSLLHQRLNSNRVSDVSLHNDQVKLNLQCTCSVSVSLHGTRLVVVDISDNATEMSASPAPSINPPKRLVLEAYPEKPPTFPITDYSVADHESRSLTRQTASQRALTLRKQLEENLALQAKSNSVFGPLNATAPTNPKPRTSGTTTTETTCDVADQFHTYLTKTTDAAPYENRTSPLKESAEARASTYIFSYLSSGLFREALASLGHLPNGGNKKQLATLVKLMLGTLDKDQTEAISSCNPTLQLIALANSARKPDLLKGSEQLGAVTQLRQLPIGFQLTIYPRLRSSLGMELRDLLPELEHQYALENKLIRQTERARRSKSPSPPANEIAAIAKELQNTEHASQSWQATFEAYLSENRYFDALDAMASIPETLTEKRANYRARFANAITENADAATFVEIMLGNHAESLDDIPEQVAIDLLERLVKEGFPKDAVHVAERWGFGPKTEAAKLAFAQLLISAGSAQTSLALLNGLSSQDASTTRASALRSSGKLDAALEQAIQAGEDDQTQDIAWLAGQFSAMPERETTRFALGQAMLRLTDSPQPSEGISALQAAAEIEKSSEMRAQISNLLSE